MLEGCEGVQRWDNGDSLGRHEATSASRETVSLGPEVLAMARLAVGLSVMLSQSGAIQAFVTVSAEQAALMPVPSRSHCAFYAILIRELFHFAPE